MYLNTVLSRDDLDYVFQGQYSASNHRLWLDTILRDATRILCQDLLFTDESCLHEINLSSIQDDYEDISHGYSFMSDPRNNFREFPWVSGEEYERRFAGIESVSSSFVSDFDGSSPVSLDSLNLNLTCPTAVHQYEQNVQTFLEYLILLILIAGEQPDGVPAAGDTLTPELVTLRFCNQGSARPRNIFVVGDMVAVFTPDAVTRQKQPTVMRLLPREVSTMLVLYLVCVQPLLAKMSPYSPAAMSDYLFPTASGHWDVQSYLMLIGRESQQRLGKDLRLEDINVAHIRYKERTNPSSLTPQMRSWHAAEQAQSLPSPVDSWSFSTSPYLLNDFQMTPPPMANPPLLEIALEGPQFSTINTGHYCPSYQVQPLPIATPIRYDLSWSASSDMSIPSSPESLVHVRPTPVMATSYRRERKNTQSSRPQITMASFCDQTPHEKMASNFRPHKGEINHGFDFFHEFQEDFPNRGRRKAASQGQMRSTYNKMVVRNPRTQMPTRSAPYAVNQRGRPPRKDSFLQC